MENYILQFIMKYSTFAQFFFFSSYFAYVFYTFHVNLAQVLILNDNVTKSKCKQVITEAA